MESTSQEQAQPVTQSLPVSPLSEEKGFDWLSLGVVILLAAVFAIAARMNTQPASSLMPAAVLSATGCGLLVTAIRKIHALKRPGILEAALGGLFLALAQFLAAITYPNVLSALSADQSEAAGFLTTWGLVGIFSILFSMAGAALGHLAFAPLRPLPIKPSPAQEEVEITTLPEDEEDGTSDEEAVDESELEEESHAESLVEATEDQDEEDEQTDSEAPSPPPAAPTRSLISYVIAILLLGLAPTLTAYVFSAAFDIMLSAYHFFAGPYSSLRLLSTLLPWQLPIHIDLNPKNPNASIFLLWTLWRIPLFLGNPTFFDFQALESYIFNGAGLTLLLLTTYGKDSTTTARPLPWSIFLLLEATFGLVLVLPADMWMLKGLLGLLQIDVLNLVVQIRTLHILDPRTFALNLITGPTVCTILAIFLRRHYGRAVAAQ